MTWPEFVTLHDFTITFTATEFLLCHEGPFILNWHSQTGAIFLEKFLNKKPEIFFTKIPHYRLILGRTSESLLESEASNNSSRFFFLLGTSSSVTLSESMDSFPFDFLAAIFFFFGEITTSVKKNFLFTFFNCVNSNNTLCSIKIC